MIEIQSLWYTLYIVYSSFSFFKTNWMNYFARCFLNVFSCHCFFFLFSSCIRLITSLVSCDFCQLLFYNTWPMTVSFITLEQDILFFFIDEDKWKTEARTERGAINDYTISYQNLVPDTSYTFRVIAYNKYGISFPAKSNDEVII